MLEPGGHKAGSMFGKELRGGCLVCLGRGCGEGERNLTRPRIQNIQLPRQDGNGSRAGVARLRSSIWRSLGPKRR